MSSEGKKCDDCDNCASSFQCPLCQAETVTNRGFFCSQECFAKNWLNHRNTFHKKGVVRAKQPAEPTEAETSAVRRKRVTSGATATDEKKKKRKVEAKGVETEPKESSYILPWSPLLKECCGGAEVTPSLPVDVPRAVVGCPSTDGHRTAFWSAVAAASHHIASVLAAKGCDNDNNNNNEEVVVPPNILVVASNPLSAHAMAWGLRCAGLAGTLRLVVSAAAKDIAVDPSKYFSAERRIVITTQDIVRSVGSESVSLWLPTAGSLLVTLPGVVDACDLQTVHTRAVFFVHCSVGSKSMGDGWCVEEKIIHQVSPLINPPAQLHHYFDISSTIVDAASRTSDNKVEAKPNAKIFHFDNDVSTSLSRGDILGAVQHLVRLYSTHRGIFEDVFVNTFLSSLGAASVAHSHHMVAYVARHLVDHSSRFSAPQGGTLKEMTLRSLARVVRLLPPIKDSDADKEIGTKKIKGDISTDAVGNNKRNNNNNNDINSPLSQPSSMEKKKFLNYYESVPNLQLQATICYLYDHAPPGMIDTFGAAWGVNRIVAGLEELKVADRKREDAVQRVRSRYGSKLSSGVANYLVVLMHFIYDAVAIYSLSLEEVEKRTLWSITLEQEVGSISTFLSNCFLLQKDETSSVKSKKEKQIKLSSRKLSEKPPSRIELLRSLPVRTASIEEPLFLSWTTLPLAGKRQRAVEQMHRQAVEEILMAMPRNPRPMYVGDVGNLIGKWHHFNTRFDGVLGVSLMEFLMQHPESFRTVGNIVTRRTAGVSEQVKMRFDNDDSGDDEDGNDSIKERKAKDRALLIGAKGTKGAHGLKGKNVPARAYKRSLVKAFNQSRFNRNYRPIDPSAKVPGYVKHAPRKVKGRGRKANKRNTKRGG